MSGVTETGFDRRTITQITDEVKAELRTNVSPKLVLDESTPDGNIVAIVCGKLGEAWEAIEGAYHAFDPDGAIGEGLVSLAELTGTRRRLLGTGIVLTTCVFANAGPFDAGALVAHVAGDPTNRWHNRDAIGTVNGATSVTFVSERSGSLAIATAGTLTVIAQSVIGWTSITNPSDATPGTDLETIEALRARRRVELAGNGSASLRAIVAAVSRVTGVLFAVGEENKTEFPTYTGIPGHSFQITIYGPGVSGGDVARAIGEARSGGFKSHGFSTAEYVDADGVTQSERWSTATTVPLTIACTVESANGVAEADVKQAILDAHRLGIGIDAAYGLFAGAPYTVPGVDLVTAFTLNGGTVNLAIGPTGIATLALGSITVTGDVT